MQEDGIEWSPKTWDKEKGCLYLMLDGFQWRCGVFLKADLAKRAAMTEDMGIGFGCSSSLGNTERDKILFRLRSSSASLATSSGTSAVKTR
jgi:hypothetical protein